MAEPDASSCSPTATTSTTSSSAPSPAATTCCARPPVQAADRADLRAKLLGRRPAASSSRPSRSSSPRRRATDYPLLSDRRNIVVIADEAHRSQYDFIDGFARHMRDALPQRLVHRLHRHADREDRRQHARRLRRLHQHLRHPARRRGRRDRADLLREPAGQAGAERSRAAEDRPGVRGGRPRARRSSARRSSRPSGRSSRPWSAPRSGSSSIADDLVEHFEKRLAALDGKAMIVCMSRRICVELYNAIVDAAARLARATTTSRARSRS